METTFLHNLKKRAGKLIEPALLKPGKVLDVREWEPATMIEIDLHLPTADMQHWIEVPYIKFRVDDLTFRDYTPACWDAETNTCTLLIDANHNGPGTLWAKQLKRNDKIQYLKVDTTHQSPDPNNLVVGLGDQSSVGHMLGLEQLVYPRTRFMGALAMDDTAHHNLFSSYFKSGLQPVSPSNGRSVDGLLDWVTGQGFCTTHTWFYLAGNHNLVSALRHELRALGFLSSQIRVKGFWS